MIYHSKSTGKRFYEIGSDWDLNYVWLICLDRDNAQPFRIHFMHLEKQYETRDPAF